MRFGLNAIPKTQTKERTKNKMNTKNNPCKLCGKNAVVERPNLDGVGKHTLCLECESLRDAGKFGELFSRACAQTLRLVKAMLQRRSRARESSGIEWTEPQRYYWQRPGRRYELASERRRRRDKLTFWRWYGVGMTVVALIFLWLAINRS